MINPAPFIIKDRNAQNGFVYTVTFPINSMAAFGFTVEFSGGIATVTAMNISSYTLKKNGSPIAFPFNVVAGDVLSIESVVKIDSARASTFLFNAPKFDAKSVSISALTQVNATRKHLFVINYTDQTISVIDTDTDTVESTLTLPGGGASQYRALCYRSADDYIYVFGLAKVCKIDANPASGTFKNIYNLTGTINSETGLSGGVGTGITDAVYDYVNDRIYLGVTVTESWYKFNFTSSLSSVPFNQNNSCGVYIPNNKLYQTGGFITKVQNDLASAWFSNAGVTPTTKGCYITKDNAYVGGRVAIVEFNADSLAVIRNYVSSSNGGNHSYPSIFGNHVYSPFYDLLISLAYEFNGGEIHVVDKATNTWLGEFVRTNKQTNDTIARSMVYGVKNKKFYFLANGTSPQNRVHVLNPQLWIDNGKVALTDMIAGFITVGNLTDLTGNTSTTANRYANCAACFNHLIPS